MKGKLNTFAIGEAIKETRLNLGMSQAALANRAKTKQSFISSLEMGRVRLTMEMIIKISKAMRVDAKRLLMSAAGVKKESDLITEMFKYFK